MNNLLINHLGNSWIPLVIAFCVAVVVAPVLIPWLHRLKFGQQILEDGPVWHKNKQGTPTMGGVIFILGVSAASLVAMLVRLDVHYLFMFLISLGFGVIGFIDDYIKVVKKRNLGLIAWQKLLLQCALAAIYVLGLVYIGELNTEVIIPFVKNSVIMPWWLYIPFVIVVMIATVNSVNLTDGLDGLATVITIVVTLFFGIVGLFVDSASAFFAAAVIGGLLAFFIFNRHPAKVFMGDTGSLFLGGVVSTLAIGLKMPLILIIVGFVYLFEALSVILQVASFQLTGKRIFKMSPIHHHFEMCGWKENKIVAVFKLVTIILCIVGFLAVRPYLSI